jgi:hypothetical protein
MINQLSPVEVPTSNFAGKKIVSIVAYDSYVVAYAEDGLAYVSRNTCY